MSLQNLKKEMQKLANPSKAKLLQGFFKTGKGEYAEGDIFLGVMVPQTRELVKKYKTITPQEVQILLSSKFHEERLLALLILIEHFKIADEEKKEKIFHFYLNNTKNINNWDLVDLTAPNIVGKFLSSKPKDILSKLAKSNNLWERRISILATFQFIRSNQFDTSLKIAELLLHDKHDLIHKAVGWMLREIGKRNQQVEEQFLKRHYKTMPRTMLRYAIEKFQKPLQQKYLKDKI